VPLLDARAERLPFETASVAAVVGLCVMDVVPDPRAVAREISRVLKPGGCFVHWLDMSPVLDEVIDLLRQAELVSFPNFVSDPSAGEWPEDLYVMSRHGLAIVIELLREAGVSLARPLAEYSAIFCSGASRAATAELIALQENGDLRRALASAFQTAILSAPPGIRAQLASCHAQTVSTARHFDEQMHACFEQAHFDRRSWIERAWQARARTAPERRYRSCLVGEQRHLSFAPQPPLCANAASAADEALIELGVLTFLATRMQD